MKKVLTVSFDVTDLSQDAIDSLCGCAQVQAEEFEIIENGQYSDKWASAPVLESEIKEIE